MMIGPIRIDWFGLKGRNVGPRGPRWFVSKGANFFYVALGGVCSVTLPWFMSRIYLDSQKWDEGWRAGYESGLKTRDAA